MHTLFILLKKEFIQFRRNKFIPKMVVMFPVMAMLVISLVTTMDVKNVNVAVVDLDKKQAAVTLSKDIPEQTFRDVIGDAGYTLVKCEEA